MKKILIVAADVTVVVSMIVAVINCKMTRDINKKLYRIKEGPRGFPGPKGDRGNHHVRLIMVS